jgi:hypothetical protein
LAPNKNKIPKLQIENAQSGAESVGYEIAAPAFPCLGFEMHGKKAVKSALARAAGKLWLFA